MRVILCHFTVWNKNQRVFACRSSNGDNTNDFLCRLMNLLGDELCCKGLFIMDSHRSMILLVLPFTLLVIWASPWKFYWGTLPFELLCRSRVSRVRPPLDCEGGIATATGWWSSRWSLHWMKRWTRHFCDTVFVVSAPLTALKWKSSDFSSHQPYHSFIGSFMWWSLMNGTIWAKIRSLIRHIANATVNNQ